MKVNHITCSLKLPITSDVAWAFFANPVNLEQLTPPGIGFLNQSHDRPKQIYPGLLQIYRFKLFGLIPVGWLAEIVHVDTPYSFIDEQKRGPFAFWQHRHVITAIPEGVEVSDTVQYVMPFGPVGQIIHDLFLKHELARMFQYRAQMLEEFFGAL
jgi:ligand-binding SRPBCC domain-containing protein